MAACLRICRFKDLEDEDYFQTDARGGREDYLAKFPAVEDLDNVKTDGKIDEAKVRQALKQLSDSGFITWSAGDSRPVCAFAIEFLRQLTHVSRSADLDDENRAHIGPTSKHDATMSRRFDRGVYAFVRIDIGRKIGFREGVHLGVVATIFILASITAFYFLFN